MSSLYLWMNLIGLLCACLGVGLTVAFKNKFADVCCSLLALAAGVCLGLANASHYSVDYIHNEVPRITNATEVKWEGDVVTFPAPTEAECRWYIVTPKIGGKGVLVQGKTFTVETGLTTGDVKVYLSYPDKRTSTEVVIPKSS